MARGSDGGLQDQDRQGWRDKGQAQWLHQTHTTPGISLGRQGTLHLLHHVVLPRAVLSEVGAFTACLPRGSIQELMK